MDKLEIKQLFYTTNMLFPYIIFFYYLHIKCAFVNDYPGLDINVCPIPVKTDVGQVKKSDSQMCRYDGQIYFHWYKILGLLYKRAPFDLQFAHNLPSDTGSHNRLDLINDLVQTHYV
jgi:hypothetical protein